jgi:hypothetical protein
MAFAVIEPARLPLSPHSTAGPSDDAYQGFTCVADRAVDPTPLRTRPLSHARGHHYRGPRRLPGPDSHRQVVLNLSLLRHAAPPLPHGAEAVPAHPINWEATPRAGEDRLASIQRANLQATGLLPRSIRGTAWTAVRSAGDVPSAAAAAPDHGMGPRSGPNLPPI